MQAQPHPFPYAAPTAERKALTTAFFRLMQLWDLTQKEVAALLGWDYTEKRTRLDSMRQGKTILDNDRDKLDRVIDLINIHKCLRLLFPHAAARKQIHDWVKVKRERFGGYSAFDIMLHHGKEGIAAIRRYLEFERTR